ncbi:hypothetical protein E2C01_037060 [Portunus trituberculatus]|uniref:Uncharacterized protein n=1 Tax=Portunus trituberculatus TaxID=210409 RepID=A0A5B7FEB0_PORTR|nr:hypothetical protein [Portunus trituberculatus]
MAVTYCLSYDEYCSLRVDQKNLYKYSVLKDEINEAYSDSDSEWSSLERRRSTDSYKVNRKAVPKRMKKKRLPIPVAAPRVPPLPSFYVAEGGPGTRYSDERLLLDPYEKGTRVVSGSASDDSEATDREDPTAPHSKYKPQKHTISFKKKMGGREGVAVRPPVVPPLPPTHNPSHPPTSHPRMGLAATPHHNPLSYPLVAQLPPDTELFSPSCKSCLILPACFLVFSFFPIPNQNFLIVSLDFHATQKCL